MKKHICMRTIGLLLILPISTLLCSCAMPPKPTQPEGERIAINQENVNSDEALKKLYEEKLKARENEHKNKGGKTNVSQN